MIKQGMCRLLIVVLALIPALVWVACPPAEQRVDYTGVIAEMMTMIPLELEASGITGLSIGLVVDQETIWTRGFGYADKEIGLPAEAKTVYRIGSISKLFTDMGIMQLVEQGKIDLDAPITDYYPEFHLENPYPDAEPVTLRRLMSHTACIPRECPTGGYFDAGEPTIGETVFSLNGCRQVLPPGTKTKYSNIGVTIVGYILGKVSGRPFVDYQREMLLEPIGMADSDFLPTDRIKRKLSKAFMWVADGQSAESRRIEAPAFNLGTLPAGNLFSTVEDLCRFHSMLFAAGKVGDRQIIKAETLRKMMERQPLKDGTPGRFGLGFVAGEFHGFKTYGHGGAVYGFSSSFFGIPEQKVGVVVLANEDIANSVTEKIALFAAERLLEAKGIEIEREPVTRPIVEASPEFIEACLGDYQSEEAWARVTRREGKPVISISGQEAELRPYSPTEFVAESMQVSRIVIPFATDEQGAVTGFKLGDAEFARGAAETPEVPELWQKFTGSYGPDFIPVIVTIKHGRLYAFVENVSDCRLFPVSDTVFEFHSGLYHDERLEFLLDAAGAVEKINMAQMEFTPLEN